MLAVLLNISDDISWYRNNIKLNYWNKFDQIFHLWNLKSWLINKYVVYFIIDVLFPSGNNTSWTIMKIHLEVNSISRQSWKVEENVNRLYRLKKWKQQLSTFMTSPKMQTMDH